MPAQGRGPAVLVAWPMPSVAAVAEAGRGAARAAAAVEGVVVAAGVVDGVVVAAAAATAPVAVARVVGVVRVAAARAAGRADAEGLAPTAGCCLTLCVPAGPEYECTYAYELRIQRRGLQEANLTACRFAPSE